MTHFDIRGSRDDFCKHVWDSPSHGRLSFQICKLTMVKVVLNPLTLVKEKYHIFKNKLFTNKFPAIKYRFKHESVGIKVVPFILNSPF